MSWSDLPAPGRPITAPLNVDAVRQLLLHAQEALKQAHGLQAARLLYLGPLVEQLVVAPGVVCGTRACGERQVVPIYKRALFVLVVFDGTSMCTAVHV